MKLSNGAASPLDVYYYTTNGAGQFGAVSGTDFAGNDSAHVQKITFAPGQTSQTILIDTTAPGSDPVAGPNKSFLLHLAGVVNTQLAAGQQKPLAQSRGLRRHRHDRERHAGDHLHRRYASLAEPPRATSSPPSMSRSPRRARCP